MQSIFVKPQTISTICFLHLKAPRVYPYIGHVCKGSQGVLNTCLRVLNTCLRVLNTCLRVLNTCLRVLNTYSYLSNELDYQIHNVTNVVNKLLTMTHAFEVCLMILRNSPQAKTVLPPGGLHAHTILHSTIRA